MNAKEKWLLERLKDYKIITQDADRLELRLQEIGCKISANYGFTGGGGGRVGSKVENFVLRRDGIERELQEKNELLSSIDRAIEGAGLTERERELIICTIRGESLSGYARRKNIYKSSVYKIRDGALRKMVKFMCK